MINIWNLEFRISFKYSISSNIIAINANNVEMRKPHMQLVIAIYPHFTVYSFIVLFIGKINKPTA